MQNLTLFSEKDKRRPILLNKIQYDELLLGYQTYINREGQDGPFIVLKQENF